jgi:hypothetical protein
VCRRQGAREGLTDDEQQHGDDVDDHHDRIQTWARSVMSVSVVAATRPRRLRKVERRNE